MKNIEHEIHIQIIKSECTNLGGVEVGVQVTHIETGLTALRTSYSSQYQNKLTALALLKKRLVVISASLSPPSVQAR